MPSVNKLLASIGYPRYTFKKYVYIDICVYVCIYMYVCVYVYVYVDFIIVKFRVANINKIK